MLQNYYIILIPLLPLLGFFINGCIAIQKSRGRGFIGNPTVSFAACFLPFLSFGLSIYAFITLYFNPTIESIALANILDWMVTDQFHLSFGLLVDHLTSIMILIVTGVGFLIHLYSIGYMQKDEGYAKYMAYLNLFLFFMLVLVMADSLVLLFVGWEGVGLCSYLLIGFWFTDIDKAIAGKKAFIVNRIGDFGFMIGMFLIVALLFDNFTSIGDLDAGKDFLSFAYIKQHANILAPAITFITLSLFFGATGKSAQIPLYIWLPDAMAGPTPVSALIHAATMVTAGVYMIARLHFLFVLSPFTMHMIATIGLLTAFFAALIALTQYDIKKVLAYSTISQLGFMFLALGVGAFAAAPFHLFTHAFFKAGLFLGAGSIIHSLRESDIRFMGGLWKKMPITAVTFLICTLAIIGIPPLSGFFSKDEIIYMTYANGPHQYYYWFALLTAGITAVYMSRLFVYTFTGKTRYHSPEKIHESPWTMTFPLIVLAFLAIIGGAVGIPGHSWWAGWLKTLGQVTPHHIEGAPLQEFQLMGISAGWAILCSAVAFLLYKRNLEFMEGFKRRFRLLYSFVYHKFRVDELYNALIVKPIKTTSEYVLYKFFDEKIIDGLMVNGLAYSSRFIGRCLATLQTGLIGHYLLYLLLGLCFVMAYVVL